MQLKSTLFSLLFLCLLGSVSNAQIADGSIAPDFTLTDIDGNVHHLYDYLNDGKLVVLDFSATWCGPCWNYHQSGALENLHNQYGPDGTNEVVVLWIEADLSTDMQDLNGTDPQSQGDWISTTSYPIIDLQSSATSNDYQIAFYPTIFTICPTDFTVYEAGQAPTATLYSWIQSCTLTGALDATVDANCFGEGSASLEVSGGLAPITYSWNNGTNDAELTGVGGGTYACTVTEANGKISVIENVVINGPALDLVINEEAVNDNLCFGDAGGSIETSVQGGTAGYTFQWDNGATDQNVSGLTAGDYQLVVTDANGCVTEALYTIEDPELLVNTLDAVAAEACDQTNGSVSFTTIGGTGNYNAQLSGPVNLVGTNVGEFTDLPAGEYTLDITDENGCATQESFVVDFIDAPIVDVLQNGQMSCQTPEVTIDALVTGGTTDVEYSWYTFDGNIVSDFNSETISVNAPGEYFVDILDLATGCTAENAILVTADVDFPIANAGADGAIDCETALVTLDGSASSTGAEYTVLWTDADGNAIGSDYQVQVNAPGEYTILITNTNNGCTSAETVLVVDETIDVVPAFSFAASEYTVSFTDLTSGNASSWSWDMGNGDIVTDQSFDYTYTMNGTYSVCLTATNGCGSQTICQDVVVDASANAIVITGSGNDVSCFGGNDGSIVLNVTGGAGGFTYQWAGPNNFENSEQNLTQLPAGTYVVTARDQDGNTQNFTVEIGQPDEILTTAAYTHPSCFGGADGSISVTVTGGVEPYSYSWTDGITDFSDISGLPEGLYQMTVIDANGCEAISQEIILDDPEQLVGDISSVSNLCFGDANGSAEVIVTGGVTPYTYEWSNGSSEQATSNLPAGLYQCVVTDANGCELQFSEVEVTQPDDFLVSTISVVNATGVSNQDGSIQLDLIGGTPPYTYTWNNGETTEDLDNIVPGTYILSVIDANGCEFSTGEIEVSFSVSTQDPVLSSALLLSPNPAKDHVTLNWTLTEQMDLEFKVYDMLGQVMDQFEYAGSTEGTKRIRTAKWTPGLYFISVRDGDRSAVKKLVVE